MRCTTLIPTATLAAHLNDPGWVVIDCRHRLDDEAWGEREYAAAHIPGAMFAHLDHDLSGPRNGTNGRHPLPDPLVLAETFGRLGIGRHAQVAAYDQDSGMFASRLWWLLRWLGHDTVAVLDGGLARWTAEARPLGSGVEERPRREFRAAPRPDLVVNASQVAGLLGRSEWRLLDARAPERFRGEVEPIDRVPGHIPGAINHFFQSNLDEHGTFRSAEDLRDRFRRSIGDAGVEHVVCYCGSGVTACHNLLALEHAGMTGAKLYPGSWSEWSSNPARPIERNEAGESRD